MTKAVIFGYGNVGRAVADTLAQTPDIELAGIVSAGGAGGKFGGLTIVGTAGELPPYDVAILARPSREVPGLAEKLLAQGVCTVDSFDIHSEIPAVRKKLGAVAQKHGKAAVISAGWDPGSDSVLRALFETMAPRGITYTNFGPGMSMGHSVAVRAIEGVREALSLTIPAGTGIHRRMVYVELLDGYTLADVAARIKADEYFVHDDTHVSAVESVAALRDMGHGVLIERKGGSGGVNNQLFTFDMRIDNPALTAQVMVASARAAVRQVPGCYTMIEIAPVDFLPMSRDEAVAKLV